ncbi:molecular chaperone [Kluyvera intermedia]|uniref:fimbrial biogenesis chaperone n=1 Tax=Kluyvera intermedia TaxID=61648 RepID=UPI001F465C9E|nr:molecular chaperone [Kluyvera intermedia]MCE9888282.1 molecular chaperone [Kluyvera intermedia]
MQRFIASLSLSLLLLSATAQAGIVMGGTRVIYEEGKREASMSVTNADSAVPYLVQSWVDNYSATKNNAPPFIVTPPLFRLDPEQKNVLRINFTGATLPMDRESVFWLNVKSISPSNKDDANKLQVNIKSKFKIFYRPKNLPGDAEEAWQKLTFQTLGSSLVAHNPTPYFVSFFSLSVGNEELDEPGMIAPFSNKSWPAHHAGTVKWRAINDFGGVTDFAQR